MWQRWKDLPSWARVLAGAVAGLPPVACVLFALVLDHPHRVVPFANLGLGTTPVRLIVDDSDLWLRDGLLRPDRWVYHLSGVAVLSADPSTPSVHIEDLWLAFPSISDLLREGWLTSEHASVVGLQIHQPVGQAAKPFQETATWPIRGFRVRAVAVRHLGLHLRDKGGTLVAFDSVNGQVRQFQYDFGHKHMYLHGNAHGVGLRVGPALIDVVEQGTIDMLGTRLEARGVGLSFGEEATVKVAIDELFRQASLYLELRMQDVAVRRLLKGMLDRPPWRLDGSFSTVAHLRTGPGVDGMDAWAEFELQRGTIDLTDVDAMAVFGLKVLPMVRVHDRVAYLSPLKGTMYKNGPRIDFPDVRYAAHKSTGLIQGRLYNERVRAKVHFVPDEGTNAIEWGVFIDGPVDAPNLKLVNVSALRDFVVTDP